jgi:fibronectin type 3 domain-containing protein
MQSGRNKTTIQVVIAAWFSGISCLAANPLALTPGTAADKVLGQIQTLSNFNTSIATSDISYNNSDLSTRNFTVRLPAGYDSGNPTKKYGLVTYIDAGGGNVFPSSYAAALDVHDVIWLSGHGIDNSQFTNLRRGVATMGAFRMTELYNIDPARIYVSGLSGGGRIASDLGYLRSDYFHGFIGRVGSSLPAAIPNWECAGTNASNADANYEFMATGTIPSTVVLPPYFRSALMTQYGDFRRTEQMAVYRYGHLNHGNPGRIIIRNGGHSDEVGPSFTDALDFLHHPLADVIWDRFENNNPAANVQAGKTVAGSGFTALSGNVSETTYAYNSVNHGVLKLTGDGGAAKANETFTWQNAYGALIDARLRAENATTPNQNQKIGLHIIPANATGTAADQPGFHLFWCYGAPCRAELVSATGVRKTLATWEHAATHPMNLAATDKAFWGDTAAPDYAGKTKSFRGEDVRVVLNSTGFQLTFNRATNNLTTAYPGVVSLFNDTSTPYAENLPVVLQGLWSEVETALVNALPAGDWQLVLTNRAIVSGQTTGNAVIDEIRVVGSAGPQAAPPITVSAPANLSRTVSWTRIHGAMSYLIQRASAPDGPFTTIATPANTASTFSDTVSSNIAWYYRVAAVGSDGETGTWSNVAFAARNVSPPSAPTNPVATYPAAYQIRLDWADNANNETAYRIERSPAGREQWALVSGSLAANSTFGIDDSVTPGASYDYRISAVGSGGLSGYATVTATVPDAAPPTPTGLTAIGDYGRVFLTWDAVAQAASYQVKRATASGGPFTTIANNLPTPAYDDAAVVAGTTYFYVVTAVSGTGLLESSNSGETSASALVLPAPSGLGGTSSYRQANLSWTAVPEATGGYRLQRATNPAGPYTAVADNLLATSYADTTLSPGTTYHYIVQSLRDGITSLASASFTLSTLAYQSVPVMDSSLKLHLDATIPEKLVRDASGKVSRWNDVDGGTSYASQATASLQPTWRIDSTLGKPVVDFGAYSENSSAPSPWMQFKDAAGADLFVSTIRTVFAVMKGSNFLLGDAGSFHFHRGGSSATSPLWDGGFSSANIRNGQTFLNGGATAINGTNNAMPSTYWLASVVTTGNVTASRLANDRGFRTGGQQIAEILIYDRALTDNERRSVEAYLMAKWFPTPLQSLRQQYFGTSDNTGTAADTFDADSDGLQNLIEYALGTIPNSAASAAPPTLGTAANHLTLSFQRIANPTLIYQVEASPDLSAASWSSIWQSTGAQNTPGPVTVTDSAHDITSSTPPRRFLRLRVNAN